VRRLTGLDLRQPKCRCRSSCASARGHRRWRGPPGDGASGGRISRARPSRRGGRAHRRPCSRRRDAVAACRSVAKPVLTLLQRRTRWPAQLGQPRPRRKRHLVVHRQGAGAGVWWDGLALAIRSPPIFRHAAEPVARLLARRSAMSTAAGRRRAVRGGQFFIRRRRDGATHRRKRRAARLRPSRRRRAALVAPGTKRRPHDAKADAMALLPPSACRSPALTSLQTRPAWFHPAVPGRCSFWATQHCRLFGEFHPEDARKRST